MEKTKRGRMIRPISFKGTMETTIDGVTTPRQTSVREDKKQLRKMLRVPTDDLVLTITDRKDDPKSIRIVNKEGVDMTSTEKSVKFFEQTTGFFGNKVSNSWTLEITESLPLEVKELTGKVHDYLKGVIKSLPRPHRY